jgi:hypothetical protein
MKSGLFNKYIKKKKKTALVKKTLNSKSTMF